MKIDCRWFIALVLAGCASMNSEAVFKDSGLSRAAFDLSCPTDQVKSTVLVRKENVANQIMDGTQVGVNGCGKKATYIFIDGGRGWVLNSPVQPQ